jgi:hypothetical protein
LPTGDPRGRLPSCRPARRPRGSRAGCRSSLRSPGSLAVIFSFEGSKKWILREGVNGTSSSGRGRRWRGAWRSRGGCAWCAAVAAALRRLWPSGDAGAEGGYLSTAPGTARDGDNPGGGDSVTPRSTTRTREQARYERDLDACIERSTEDASMRWMKGVIGGSTACWCSKRVRIVAARIATSNASERCLR